MRRAARLGALIVGFITLAPSLRAQRTTDSSDVDRLRPIAHAVRRTGDIHIDGALDESAWAAATPIVDLVQQDPNEGAAPSERTEIRILYDDDALYVGARMYDRAGRTGVRAVLTRRDELLTSDSGQTDKIQLAFDTFRNNADQTVFELNPLGVKGDEQNGDPTFDPVWDGAARVDSLGWTAEFRIPFSQLHFSRDSVQTWGMQIWRLIARRNERDMWSFWRKTEFGGPASFGTLTGLTIPASRQRLEVTPYVTSRGTFSRAASADPFHSTTTMDYRAGTDLKLNLTSNLTLDATVNPDFGQVEVDPAVVNLSAFETTYDEKRPFFTSGSQYFSFGGPDCFMCFDSPPAGTFYTRRIGRTPQLTGMLGPQPSFIDAPDATTILGATKVTGRTSGGLGVGMLDAVTSGETARFVVPGETGVQREEIEPRTNYFVARLRQDLREGRTGIGMLLTRVDRQLTNPLERAWLRRDATVARIDMDQHSADRTYNVYAGFDVSDVTGDTAAIRRTQESSARYFQRPGRGETSDGLFDARYDPTRRELRGYMFYVRAGKDAGSWQWDAANFTVSPGMEINDIGRLQRADDRWSNATLRRVWSRPSRWTHNAALMIGGEDRRDFDGHRTGGQINLGADVTFPSYWTAQLRAFRRPTYDDPTLTRGGPLEKRYGFDQMQWSLTSDQRLPVVVNAVYKHGFPIDNGEGGGNGATLGVTLKPTPRASISLVADYLRDATAQQYVMALADSTAPAGFGGSRDVFGRVQQKTFSLTTRVNAAFTPTLTLEMYAQPYLSSAAYTDFKEFAGVDTRAMIHYGADAQSTISVLSAQHGRPARYTVDPDGPGRAAPFTFDDPSFSYRSLRGTAVLRWEYARGSTFYFVWTQQRAATIDDGAFDLGRSAPALFRDRPINVFQVKATYWIGR